MRPLACTAAFCAAIAIPLALLCACMHTPPEPVETPPQEVVAPVAIPPAQVEPPQPLVSLPDDWATSPRAEFAAALERWLPPDTGGHLDERALGTLARALGAGDESSVRAALILGCTRDARAGEVLLSRLEVRVPARSGTFAGDVVGAAAFAGSLPNVDAGARLEELARGRNPHPVLEVRVECAAASLALHRDGAIPFLLAILREGTPAATARPDWTRRDPDDPRLVRLQDRAARALSDHVGIECAFRAQASVAARESEIARLANLAANLARAAPAKR